MAVLLGNKIIIPPDKTYQLILEKECGVCGLEMQDHVNLSNCYSSLDQLVESGGAVLFPSFK